MENDNVKYGILLSKEQLAVLGKKRGYNRMNLYRALCEKTAIVPYDTTIRGVKVHIDMGECLYPNTKLEKDLGINRKTVQDVIHELNMVGIIKTETGNRCSVHVNQALAFWTKEDTGERLPNPHYSDSPECQPTKGLKPKKEKNLVSTNEDAESKEENKTLSSGETNATNDTALHSPADSSKESTQSNESACPPKTTDNPSQSSEPNHSADQNSTSSTESSLNDKSLNDKEKKENANDSLDSKNNSNEDFDEKQIQEEMKLYGQLYEAYKPYLNDKYYVDENKNVHILPDCHIIATHEDIARDFFSKAESKD